MTWGFLINKPNIKCTQQILNTTRSCTITFLRNILALCGLPLNLRKLNGFLMFCQISSSLEFQGSNEVWNTQMWISIYVKKRKCLQNVQLFMNHPLHIHILSTKHIPSLRWLIFKTPPPSHIQSCARTLIQSIPSVSLWEANI